MFGVVTRNTDELEWPEFDRGFYEVKDVTGRANEPVDTGVNMVSCFGDNAAAEADPQLVPKSKSGEPATRNQPYFDWAYICPNQDDYVAGLFEIIEDCAATNPDVRLDDVGFPREEYCYCDRCVERFTASQYTERAAWRANVITEFVAAATDRIPGRTYLTLYPDPYPDHLYQRSGLDLATIEPHIDEFVVPLYDTAYGTTYWLEVIASGFADRLDTPFSIELYAVNVDIDNLNHATDVASEYVDAVYYGYDAANAQATIRRRRAENNTGASHQDAS